MKVVRNKMGNGKWISAQKMITRETTVPAIISEYDKTIDELNVQKKQISKEINRLKKIRDLSIERALSK